MTQKFYVHKPWPERSERNAIIESMAWAVACVAARFYHEALDGVETPTYSVAAFYTQKCRERALDKVVELYRDRITVSLLERWIIADMIPDTVAKLKKYVGTPCPLKRGGPCTHCTQATGCLRRPTNDHIS
jgi:hypothetical protein